MHLSQARIIIVVSRVRHLIIKIQTFQRIAVTCAVEACKARFKYNMLHLRSGFFDCNMNFVSICIGGFISGNIAAQCRSIHFPAPNVYGSWASRSIIVGWQRQVFHKIRFDLCRKCETSGIIIRPLRRAVQLRTVYGSGQGFRNNFAVHVRNQPSGEKLPLFRELRKIIVAQHSPRRL